MIPALLLLFSAAPVSAGSSAEIIDTISIERHNVFNPEIEGEDWKIFQFANRIHILTQKQVVARENLMPIGSRWDPVKALETERNLRAMGFIRGAEVRPRPTRPGHLDLEIHTQDSWTLQPSLGFGTEGGENILVYGIEENNILGLGKGLSFLNTQKGTEIRNQASYTDPRLWGSRQKLITRYAKTENGNEIGTRLHRPFYSFQTPWATDVSWARVNQVDTLYENAGEFSKFNHNFHTVRAEIGHRIGTSDRFVQRVHVGSIYERQRFFGKAQTAVGTLPKDRTLSGPIVGYSSIQPKYLKETNIDSMARVEDFNLGNELTAGVAPILKSWGSDRDRLMFSALMQQGLSLTPESFLLGQVGTQGRVAGGDQLENTHIFANLNIFWKYAWPFPQTFVTHLEFNNAKNLDGENQIILGGATGLRGYKNNSFTGGRSFLLNLENRFFYDRELLHLLRVGGVIFFDIGAASPEGRSTRYDQFRSDLGLGLRVSPSRSSSGIGLRIDLAYALNDGPGSDRWVVSLNAGQAFSIFNSTNRSLLVEPDDAVTGDNDKTRLIRR